MCLYLPAGTKFARNRLNAYAGLATGYLVLDAINAAYTAAGKIPDLGSTIPLVFQDKVFVSATTPITDPTWATVAWLVPVIRFGNAGARAIMAASARR